MESHVSHYTFLVPGYARKHTHCVTFIQRRPNALNKNELYKCFVFTRIFYYPLRTSRCFKVDSISPMSKKRVIFKNDTFRFLKSLFLYDHQSRPDRDKHVKIVRANISPQYTVQFGKRNLNESTSRGYPYDYLSIMHYGDDYFSKNQYKTIKVV